MTENLDISARLSELAALAEKEDWLYQAELRLADEFSAVATAFSAANPGTEIICENYIGPGSVVRRSARSSLLRTIKTIEKSLDRLQALKPTYKIWEEAQDYFASSSPAQTYFAAEIVRRNLHA
jgi:hypothetical protein